MFCPPPSMRLFRPNCYTNKPDLKRPILSSLRNSTNRILELTMGRIHDRSIPSHGVLILRSHYEESIKQFAPTRRKIQKGTEIMLEEKLSSILSKMKLFSKAEGTSQG